MSAVGEGDLATLASVVDSTITLKQGDTDIIQHSNNDTSHIHDETDHNINNANVTPMDITVTSQTMQDSHTEQHVTVVSNVKNDGLPVVQLQTHEASDVAAALMANANNQYTIDPSKVVQGTSSTQDGTAEFHTSTIGGNLTITSSVNGPIASLGNTQVSVSADSQGMQHNLVDVTSMQDHVMLKTVNTTHGDEDMDVSHSGPVLEEADAQNQQGYQQQPTYVLLQAPGDQDSGGQPQMFLAMQTTGLGNQDPQQAYITLHPVAMEGQEVSGSFAEGVALPNTIANQAGNELSGMEVGQQISLGELKGVQLQQGNEADGNQQYFIQSGGQLMSVGGVDGNQGNIVTYLQPVSSMAGVSSGGAGGQVLMATSDVGQNAVQTADGLTHNVVSADGTVSIVNKAMVGVPGSSQSRRRLSNDPRTCEQCSRTFKYPSDLKKHLQIHTDIKKFRCEECNRCFRRLHQLNVHKRIHSGEKPYVCNRCSAQFRHDSTLTMHIRTRHDHLKPFSCEGCGKKFGRMSHLRKHQRNVCGKGAPRGSTVACKYCDQAFSRKTDLKIHMQACDKKPDKSDREPTTPVSLACDVCGKEFSRNYDFKRHQLSHTDEKPYSCLQCAKTFKERSSLNKHMKRMHLDLNGEHSMEGYNDDDEDDDDDVTGVDSSGSGNEDQGLVSVTTSGIHVDPTASAADIIVSLAANMVATSDSDDVASTQGLAGHPGVIQAGGQHVIHTAGQTITAADILNFPEVAAALGLNTVSHVDTHGTQATIITVPHAISDGSGSLEGHHDDENVHTMHIKAEDLAASIKNASMSMPQSVEESVLQAAVEQSVKSVQHDIVVAVPQMQVADHHEMETSRDSGI